MAGAVRGILLDLDGTLVDSRAATEAGWRTWAAERGLGEHADEIARTCHGVPSAAHIAHWAPALDPAAEAVAVEAAQMATGVPTPAFPGALEALALGGGIVTSGRRELARSRLASAGLPEPPVLVTAEDVEAGKPDPAPYLLGLSRLGVRPSACVVVEDAPAGVVAGRAAGCRVLAVAHTHACSELQAADACFATLAEALPALRDRV